MPRKLRQLKANLKAAGFVLKAPRGKGSHVMYVHPRVEEAVVTLSGHDGDDAKPYQERDVREALAQAARAGTWPV